jgi:hypothetical protein
MSRGRTYACFRVVPVVGRRRHFLGHVWASSADEARASARTRFRVRPGHAVQLRLDGSMRGRRRWGQRGAYPSAVSRFL